MKSIYLLLASLFLIKEVQVQAQQCSHPYKIVILGSSTSAGTGASPVDSSYVNKFRQYLTDSVNSGCEVVNLAKGGYTTRKIQPTWFGGTTDTARNIDKALSLDPDGIIINLPSNDAASSFTLQEQKDNFLRILATADSAHVPVWLTTTQPRNLSAAGRDSLVAIKDWIINAFPNTYIDFWTGIANNDGSIDTAYDSGDGVHLNNAGHHILFTRVIESNILDSLCNDADTSTAIGNLDIHNRAEVFAYHNNIVVNTAQFKNVKIEIYNTVGMRIYSGMLQQEKTVFPMQGAQVYFVRLFIEQPQTFKVMTTDY